MITKTQLEKKYKYLFDLSVYENPKTIPIHPKWGGITCRDGWNDLLDKLFNELTILDEHKQLRLFQVKEKFGELRVYIEGKNNADKGICSKAYTIIHKYENKSKLICEECGEPGKIIEGNWLRTLCKVCNG